MKNRKTLFSRGEYTWTLAPSMEERQPVTEILISPFCKCNKCIERGRQVSKLRFERLYSCEGVDCHLLVFSALLSCRL